MRNNAQDIRKKSTQIAMKDIYKHISSTLKTLRQARGWSLDKAAEETGVSKAMLGQIEREESSPTIATLWKIASGFNTSFSSFLEDIDPDLKKSIHRSNPTQHLNPTDKRIRVAPLFPFDVELNFEIFIIELLPHYEHLSPPHQTGVIEHVIAVKGAVEVLVNGTWQTLHQSEGLRFNADQAHGYRNTSSKTVCFHDIIHYPRQK